MKRIHTQSPASAHFAPRPARAQILQRKCACGSHASGGECESCRKKREGAPLQRSAVHHQPAPDVPPIVHEVLQTPGQPLEQDVRSRMERGFGALPASMCLSPVGAGSLQGEGRIGADGDHYEEEANKAAEQVTVSPSGGPRPPSAGIDFSGIRIHADSRAAESARAVGAQAYAVGNHIVFDSGKYAPRTASTAYLLAHELAHTVQQQKGGDIGVQRFSSEEHVQIGNLAAPGKTVIISGYGNVSVGEMIAMSGDYFESLDEIELLAKSAFGKEQIDLVRWKIKGSRVTKPTVSAGVEEAVTNRYDALASRNQTHFSTGSTPGNSNRERYIDLHTKAIQAAYQAGAFGTKSATFPAHIPEALEGFANHFLTDAFSAGHIRTQRGQIQAHWNGMYSNFRDNLIDFIGCHMASYIKDVDNPTFLKVALSVDTIKDGVHTWPIDKDGVKDTVRSLAGNRLNAYSVGDVISGALHDEDSLGLDVVSPSDATGSKKPFSWRAVGDNKLFPSTPNANATQTKDMVTTAVQWSMQELQNATNAGMGATKVSLSQLTNAANYRALTLIPSEDTGSKTNPTYAWKQSGIRSLPANIQTGLRNSFLPGTAIRGGLDGITVPPCSGEYHAGQAWKCFKSILLADPFEAIAKVCEGNTCPPGKTNPCSSLAAGGPCP